MDIMWNNFLCLIKIGVSDVPDDSLSKQENSHIFVIMEEVVIIMIIVTVFSLRNEFCSFRKFEVGVVPPPFQSRGR